MHEKCKGEIIIYMDDDDYYPPERVNHAVNKLRGSPRAMCAGSSAIYIYFNDTQKYGSLDHMVQIMQRQAHLHLEESY